MTVSPHQGSGKYSTDVARGHVRELAMVRLADEGVPIRALARVFVTPFDDVLSVLKDAVEDGRLLHLPASEWPNASTRAARVPTSAIVRGDAPDDLVLALRMALRLTKCEATILAALMRRRDLSKSAIHLLVSPEAKPKIVDVFVCNLRKRLQPHQIHIETVWGWGYRLSADAVRTVEGRLRQPEVEAA